VSDLSLRISDAKLMTESLISETPTKSFRLCEPGRSLKPEAMNLSSIARWWNIEQGLKLSGSDVARAEANRTLLYHRVREFMERYEFLILPVSQVAPFPVEIEWVREINGVKMESYIDWMATCYAITLTGLPAVSVPCGFTNDGLPVGLQIVGRRERDFDVLQLALAFEQATQFGKTRPSIAA
jgi:amidase